MCVVCVCVGGGRSQARGMQPCVFCAQVSELVWAWGQQGRKLSELNCEARVWPEGAGGWPSWEAGGLCLVSALACKGRAAMYIACVTGGGARPACTHRDMRSCYAPPPPWYAGSGGGGVSGVFIVKVTVVGPKGSVLSSWKGRICNPPVLRGVCVAAWRGSHIMRTHAHVRMVPPRVRACGGGRQRMHGRRSTPLSCGGGRLRKRRSRP